LILCIATLSDGKDEIFEPAYSPPKLHLGADGHLAPVEKVDIDPVMQKVADALVSNGSGRHMRFGQTSKEEKLAVQIRKSEQLIEKQKLAQEKLKQQLELQKLKDDEALRMEKERERITKEVHAQLEIQANEYV